MKTKSYKYAFSNGDTVEIDEDDVSPEWMDRLKEADRLTHNANNRERYHVPCHYDAYVTETGNAALDSNPFLTYDPWEEKAEMERQTERFDALKEAYESLSMEQKLLFDAYFIEHKTYETLALEWNVARSTIGKRVNKIRAIFAAGTPRG